MKSTTTISIIRWTARIIGTLIAAIASTWLIANFIDGLNRDGPGLETYNIIVFVFWGIGLAALFFALWKEGLGGIISLISFIIFNILAAFNPVKGSSYPFILLVFIVPSALYLLYWLLKRNILKKESQKIEPK